MRKLILFYCFIPFGLAAQVPGYMGKKISVGYRNEMSPRIMDVFYYFGKPVNYDGKEVQLYNIAMTHSLDAEWVVAKQVSLRFMYGQSNNGAFGYPDDSYDEPTFLETEYPKLSEEFDFKNQFFTNGTDVKDYDFVRTSSTMLKYGISFSKGFYVAPHGRTASIYFLQNTTNAAYVLNGAAKDFVRIQSYGFMFENTNRRIMSDALIFEYGISFGYLMGSKLSDMYAAETAAEYFTGLDTKRILFQFSVGLRYLIPKLSKTK